ncbi:TetR/AcrR family transcriptional regulator [Propionibacterium sp.]|uniref:TetR/AcrR family transcriptional regulator n=1 Tax=Propionibacterium sp. TaxID=1977903 RepID=UPI00345EC392
MTRAAPLPAEQRRESIIAAARPLLLAHGDALTTKQVARAAGVAEGTIFRVFSSKQDLLNAVVADVLDPTPLIKALDEMTPDADLDERVHHIIELLHRSMSDVRAFFAAIHAIPAHGKLFRGSTLSNPKNPDPHHPDACDDAGSASPAHPPVAPDEQMRAKQQQTDLASQAAVERALSPFADQLSVDLATAAGFLRSVTFATIHPFLMNGAPPMTPDQLSALLLHGLKKES